MHETNLDLLRLHMRSSVGANCHRKNTLHNTIASMAAMRRRKWPKWSLNMHKTYRMHDMARLRLLQAGISPGVAHPRHCKFSTWFLMGAKNNLCF